VSTELIPLAVVMFAVTYPSRALGLLAPGLDRLPKGVIAYLQLVGPAVLTALAAVAIMVRTPDDGPPVFHLGIEWVAVLACLGMVIWRRNLLLGLLVAIAIVVVARASGLAGLPPA
jgi:branched-subunit amino acid transport protein